MPVDTEHILLPGWLTGMGCEAPCKVPAKRVSLRGSGHSFLPTCEIVDEPGDLPEGLYLLSYNGEALAMRKQPDGIWVAVV